MHAGPSVSMETSSQLTKIIPGLFVTGLALLFARDAATAAYQRYVLFPPLANSTSGPPLEALYLGSSLLGFVISPCLLFAAFYALGRRISLEDDWKSAAASLFVAGIMASVLSLLVDSAMFSSSSQSFLSNLEGLFGSGWNVASWTLTVVEEGLAMVFIGISAIFLASRKTRATQTLPSGTGAAGTRPTRGPP